MAKYLYSLLFTVLFSAAAFAQMDERFYFPNKAMVPIDSVKYEEFALRADDTIHVTGVFLKPDGKAKATVLFFHGAGGNVSKYLFMTRPLVKAGYQVLMVDFRGYGKSNGKPTHQNIAADGQMFVNSALNRADVKNTKVIIYGASIGTQIAAKMAKDNKAKISGLVLDGTISSLTDIAADQSPESQRENIRQFLKFPYGAKDDIKEVGSMPKLFIHSKEDKEVPYAHGQAVFANAAEPKQFITYTGKHLDAIRTDPAKIIAAIDIMIK
nr:alpha/beta fold hydrolase [uncultured Mucilaginibacter sp.]